MTTQPDIDAIAREAAIEYVSLTNTSTIEAIIAAAIRRALEPVEKHLRTALDASCDESAVMAIAALKRENKELSAVVDAADKLERLLSRNCGSNDDWPIEIKVSGDYAQQLAGKLTALTRALKPYRKALAEALKDEP